MGFPILVRWHLYIESAPWLLVYDIFLHQGIPLSYPLSLWMVDLKTISIEAWKKFDLLHDVKDICIFQRFSFETISNSLKYVSVPVNAKFWHQLRFGWHLDNWGPLHHDELIPAWISNCIHYKMCDEINSPFPNFNDCSVGIWNG